MGEDVDVTCPWCGEHLSMWVDADARGSFVQDCEVCCRPWLVQVSWDLDDHGQARCQAWVQRS
ncbi:MAG: CPXCG motif-containing cysteine-rich protein [Myxococcota bacterium]